MGLSNKKLKLKMRDELVQSNFNAAAKLFWTLLDSAKPTPRFFKREKRRKLRSDQTTQQSNKENETETQGSPNKKTKRKKLEDDHVRDGEKDPRILL